MFTHLRPAVATLVAFTLITGVLYPLVITGVGQLLFPRKANGSLIQAHGKPIGSALIGQPFSDPQHFWGRPSATSPYPYNAAASSGSNLGPLNAALTAAVSARITALRDADPDNRLPIPVDLVTASASGLDPHVSPAAARFQAARVANARGIPTARVLERIDRHTEGRDLGALGEPRVNVLLLNLALDDLGRDR